MYNELKFCSFLETQEELNKLIISQALKNASSDDVMYDFPEDLSEQHAFIRDEKIELAKKRIKMGYYYQKEILSEIADKVFRKIGMDLTL